MIAAILRAQWLSMRLGGRRGGALSVITGVIWYLMWMVVSCVAFGAAREATAASLKTYLPLALLGVWIYWQAMPILTASMGSSLDMRKLLVYPVPHGRLFQIELLLRLATGAEAIMLVCAGSAGLLLNPAARGAGVLAGAALFMAFNLVLASGARSLLERLLSKRKVRELLVFLLFMLWMVPRLLFLSGATPHAPRGWDGAIGTAAWPWTAAAWLALGQSSGGALVSLGCWLAAAVWFGRTQFERTLRFDAVAAQSTPAGNGRSRVQALMERFYRFPSAILPDPVAAIVEKELRSLARTPRYRMVFVMGFSFGLMVWLPMILGGRAGRNPQLSHNFLTVVCVYALTLLGQVSYWNCFGFDRSAAQIYYVAPQSFRTTLIGKNLASIVYIYLESLILIAVVALFRVGFSAGQILETLLVVAICSLYMLAMGNLSSVQYPRGLSPERVSQGGASSRLQALIFLLYPLTLLPVFLAYLARYAFSSNLAFYLVLSFAAAIGVTVYWIAMESAVGIGVTKRERIVTELSVGEGPVSS